MLRFRLFLLVIVVALFATMWTPAHTHAQPTQPLRVTTQPDAVVVEWRGTVSADRAGMPQIAGWATQSLGDLLLPAELVALRVPDGLQVAPRVEQLSSQPWRGRLRRDETAMPRPLGGAERPALAAAAQPDAPDAPVVTLRDGRMRGARIVVLAISPVFAQDGALQAATSLRVTIPGATLLRDSAADLLAADGPFIANAAAPTNPAAAAQAWTIQVAQSGIQELPVAALAASGVDLSDPARLHLRLNGQEVSLEEVRDGAGALAALRFYAATPGDRWNATDTYWLSAEATPGLRMAQRDVTPGSAPLRSGALERGTWRESRLYDSLLPGPSGDHWFSADFKTGPDQPPAQLTATLTPTLPLATGTTTLTLTGIAYTASQHKLRATLGNAQANVTWTGTGNWTKVFTLTENSAQALIELVPSAVYDGIELDRIAWERPVLLDFGGRGAAFVGTGGAWRYQLANTPPDRALYDISAPRAPVRLPLLPGGSPQFEDGPAQHPYLLAGPGTLHTPAISAHMPTNLSAPLDADVLYIAPAAFHNALTPLLARREAQGYTARVVDVQAIYDAWSYGHVAPDAIRSFLRYAAATWSRAPATVLLVGDGTSDPLNYTRRNNTTFVPPYLAMVDPWIGETACDTCYAQLDGDAPQTGWSGDVLPDLALGRLPAKSADELTAIVAKILSYETTSAGQVWQTRVAYVADNADYAGDFAAFSDASAALQPAGIGIDRTYYDPNGGADRVQDPLLARAQTIKAFNSGAAFINYVGHGNQFQWAVTGQPLLPGQPDDKQYLLNSNDAGDLTNSSRLPIVLELTCLTSSFHVPAYSGTSVGERLFVSPRGGAAAVWGPTGYGVEHGHGMLQAGFYGALWNGSDQRLGTLTLAGYLKLFTAGSFPETVRTYVLLGDPLTEPRASTELRLHLPLVQGR